MDKENRIEKIFRERLYDFEYNLDDTGWIEISSRLSRRHRFYGWSGRIAVIVALIFPFVWTGRFPVVLVFGRITIRGISIGMILCKYGMNVLNSFGIGYGPVRAFVRVFHVPLLFG